MPRSRATSPPTRRLVLVAEAPDDRCTSSSSGIKPASNVLRVLRKTLPPHA
jgi:hypothetical protein